MEDVLDEVQILPVFDSKSSSYCYLPVNSLSTERDHYNKWYKAVLQSYWWSWEGFHPGLDLGLYLLIQTAKTPWEGLWSPTGTVEEKMEVKKSRGEWGEGGKKIKVRWRSRGWERTLQGKIYFKDLLHQHTCFQCFTVDWTSTQDCVGEHRPRVHADWPP